MNREQRRAEERQRAKDQRSARDQPHGTTGGWPPGEGGAFRRPAFGSAASAAEQAERARAALERAVFELDRRLSREEPRRAALAGVVEQLERSVAPGRRRLYDEVLTSVLLRRVDLVLEGGWQPSELVFVVGRTDKTAAALLAAAVVDHGRRRRADELAPAAWRRQLATLAERSPALPGPTAGHWGSVLATVGYAETAAVAELHLLFALLDRLPRMEPLLPPPSRWAAGSPRRSTTGQLAREGTRAGGREAVVERVRALLRKAESTEFPEEADACTAKAQELMTRHAIDEALLADEADGFEVVGVRLMVDSPYTLEKATLLNVVGEANRCRTVVHLQLGLATLVGTPVDLEQVELLSTSLLVQATRSMAAAGSRRTGAFDRSPSFRRSFLASYASRIGERLRQADKTATAARADGSSEVSRAQLVRVLDRQAEAVDEEFERRFPRSSRRESARQYNRHGWTAGRAAADEARFARGRVGGEPGAGGA